MLKLAISVSLVVMLGAAACGGGPSAKKPKRRSGGCPPGTELVDGRYCELPGRSQCPEGFEYDETQKICYWPCADASVDAESSAYCRDAGALDADD